MIKATVEHLDSVNHLLNICTTIYLPGCSLRCPYCFNMDVVDGENLNSYSEEELQKEINKNQSGHFVVTGGEALLNNNFKIIISMINKIKPKTIQVNTNMMHPEMLNWFLKNVKNPIVAFDFKNIIQKYIEMNPLIDNHAKRFMSSMFEIFRYFKHNKETFYCQCRTTLYKEVGFKELKTISEMVKCLNFNDHFTWSWQDLEPKKIYNKQTIETWIKEIKEVQNINILHNGE